MTQHHQRNIGVTELAMILSKLWNKSLFYYRLCFNFWFPILRNSLHVFPKTEQLWNAIFVGAFDTTFVVSKRWWWTSSDGNDFANTFDIKLISLLITFIFLPFLIINFLYHICPRKRKCKSDYLYNDPQGSMRDTHVPRGRGKSFKGCLGRGCARPEAFKPCPCLTLSAPNIHVQALQTDVHTFPLIVS